MKARARWLCLAVSLGFLADTIFGSASTWAVAGFFLFGAVWYGLTWLRTRELDGPRSR